MSGPIDNYYNELEDIKQTFSIIINEGKKAVHLSKTFPTNQTYTELNRVFESDLKEYKKASFAINTQLDADINEEEKKAQEASDVIAELESDNEALKSKITDLFETNNGTKGMFNDSQLLYNQYLLGNIYVLAAIIIPIYIYYK